MGGFLVLSGVSPKEEEKIPLAIYRYNPGIISYRWPHFREGFFQLYRWHPRPAVAAQLARTTTWPLSRLN